MGFGQSKVKATTTADQDKKPQDEGKGESQTQPSQPVMELQYEFEMTSDSDTDSEHSQDEIARDEDEKFEHEEEEDGPMVKRFRAYESSDSEYGVVGDGTTNPISSDCMSINQLPIEILEYVLKQLNIRDIRSSRLVCRKWNQEIKRHTPLAVIVKDSLDLNVDSSLSPNVAFIQSVHRPKSVHIKELQQTNYLYLFFGSDQELKIEKLKVTATLHDSFFRVIILPLANLRILDLTDKALETCDFSLGGPIIKRACLWNLEELTISRQIGNSSIRVACSTTRYYYDRRRSCEFDGKLIQQLSKNITFLLRSIASTKLRCVKLEVDTLFIDINCCIGRQHFRFEDLEMMLFISQHRKTLRDLQLCVAAPMPIKLPPDQKQLHSENLSLLPTSLETLEVQSTVGDMLVNLLHPLPLGQTRITNPFLLEHHPEFYAQIQHPENSKFWRTLCLCQNQLKKLDLNLENTFSASFLYEILKNNESTLEVLSVTNVPDQMILNCEHLQAKNLHTLELDGKCSFEQQPRQNPPKLIKLSNLPKSISRIRLFNLKMDVQDLHALTKFEKLKHFYFVFWKSEDFNFGPISDFITTLDTLLRRCNILHIGLFKKSTDPRLLTLLKKYRVELNARGIHCVSLNYCRC